MIRGHTIAIHSTEKCDGVTIIALFSTNKCDVAPSSNLHNVHLPQKSPTVKRMGLKVIYHFLLKLFVKFVPCFPVATMC